MVLASTIAARGEREGAGGMAEGVPVYNIGRLNVASRSDFAAARGAMYEHSSWVAERAATHRPFASARALDYAVRGLAGGRLTTHVLDTTGGSPASSMRYELKVAIGRDRRRAIAGETNVQGRTDQPLLADIDMTPAGFRLEFLVGECFRRRGTPLADPAFLDVVPLEFGLAAPGQHYHLPLLCSPWSYTTYRGG